MSGYVLEMMGPIGATAAHGGLRSDGVAVSTGPVAPARAFGDLVKEGLERVNGELVAAQTGIQQMAVGDVQNLHQLMIKLEESRLSFELMLHVRNRVLDAYQELMRMQV